MNISFDYDSTITGDPATFKQAIALFRSAGHKCFIVTMRYPSEAQALIREYAPLVDGIFTTGRRAKKAFMLEHSHHIHIWIDDEPRAINEDASSIWPTVSPEGHVVVVDHDKGTIHTEHVAEETPVKPADKKISERDLLRSQTWEAALYDTTAKEMAARLRVSLSGAEDYLTQVYNHSPTGAARLKELLESVSENWWIENSKWFVNPGMAKHLLRVSVVEDEVNGPVVQRSPEWGELGCPGTRIRLNTRLWLDTASPAVVQEVVETTKQQIREATVPKAT